MHVVKILDDYSYRKLMFPLKGMCSDKWSSRTERKFVCRLRQKAITCDFTDVDETVRGQLIEKCQDQKLRRKFLEKPNAKLTDLQDIARAHEAVNEQMKSMDKPLAHQPGQVNSIKQQKFQNKGRGQSENKGKKGGKSFKTQKPESD